MKIDVQIATEATPNPRTMKFVVDRAIANETAEIKSSGDAARSPLAAKLFGFPWLESVFVGPNFVTITKQDWVDWDVLAQPLAGLIKEHIDEGSPVLVAITHADGKLSVTADDKHAVSESDSDVVKQIKEILEKEIRPAVAMDGGDVLFQSYEDRRVHLLMRGSCSGCPSSAMTLKMGIEARLKEAIPEILEVVADQ